MTANIIRTINKHNTLTDGYIPKTGKAILPDKLLNSLYWKFEEKGNDFILSMTEIRDILGLKSIKDDYRIWDAIRMLQEPLQIRDFTFKGKGVKRVSAPFLSEVIEWKENKKYLNFKVNEIILEALKQKAGYTPIELNICNQFKTKYGLKLYEMYLRYYSLPNREGKGVGKVSKELDELNNIFGTSYKAPSDMQRGLNRGINEIEKITGEAISCFYNKPEKKFIFGWYQKEKYPKLRIPYERVDEFIEWYLEYKKELKIKSVLKYRVGLKKKILEDEFDDLDTFYRGMLKWKYNLNPDEYFDVKSGSYRNF
jgi:hypothetical protein